MGLDFKDGQLIFAGLFLWLDVRMKYPNKRYGCPFELQHYAGMLSDKDLAKVLYRSEKTIKRWRSGKEKIPFWVPELMRLRQFERQQRLFQMGVGRERTRLGRVRGDVIDFGEASGRLRGREPEELILPVSILANI